QSVNSGSVTINESSKDLSASSWVFRTTRQNSQLRTNLYLVNTSKILLDGTLNNFSSNGKNEVDKDDAIKILNIAGSASLAVNRDGKLLTIERRKFINKSDTIFYNTKGLSRQNYQL